MPLSASPVPRCVWLPDGPTAAPLEAVLFDLDGTLVHTPIDFGAMRRTVRALAEEHAPGVALPDHLDVLALVDLAAEAAGDGRGFRQAAEAALTAIELEASSRAVEVEGAGTLLGMLRDRGVGVGIVTRNCPEAVAKVLAAITLPHDVLLTRRDVARVKPHPEQLWRALELLGCRPDRSVMVGDHPMDVLGGRAAGMRTLVIRLPEASRNFSRAEPDGFVDRLADLARWISL